MRTITAEDVQRDIDRFNEEMAGAYRDVEAAQKRHGVLHGVLTYLHGLKSYLVKLDTMPASNEPLPDEQGGGVGERKTGEGIPMPPAPDTSVSHARTVAATRPRCGEPTSTGGRCEQYTMVFDRGPCWVHRDKASKEAE